MVPLARRVAMDLITIDNRRLQAFREARVEIPTRMATSEEIAEAVRQNKFSAGPLGSDTIRTSRAEVAG